MSTKWLTIGHILAIYSPHPHLCPLPPWRLVAESNRAGHAPRAVHALRALRARASRSPGWGRELQESFRKNMVQSLWRLELWKIIFLFWYILEQFETMNLMKSRYICKVWYKRLMLAYLGTQIAPWQTKLHVGNRHFPIRKPISTWWKLIDFHLSCQLAILGMFFLFQVAVCFDCHHLNLHDKTYSQKTVGCQTINQINQIP